MNHTLPTNPSKKPDFLCIGAQKAATTWLYIQLRRHPRVWVPTIKELNYFNNPDSSLLNILFPKNWLDHDLRTLIKKHLLPLVAEKKSERIHLRWYIRYFFGKRSLRWYQSLFPANGKVCGELSVNYAMMEPEVIHQIALALPHLKIIYILRNPIERTWSHAKMALTKQTGKRVDDLTETDYRHFFADPITYANNVYHLNLARWQTCFPVSQFHIGYYEQIKTDPAGYLKSLFAFLEIEFDPDLYNDGFLSRIFNASPTMDIPSEYARLLSKEYLPSIEEMYRRWPNQYVSAWLEDAKLHAGE